MNRSRAPDWQQQRYQIKLSGDMHTYKMSTSLLVQQQNGLHVLCNVLVAPGVCLPGVFGALIEARQR